MCGLYGYCFTDKLVGEIDENKVNDLVDIGVAYNLHRGMDAAGWAAAYDQPFTHQDSTSRLWHAKDAGRGDYNLLDPKRPVYPGGTPRSLLVHTRASTRGSASNNDNNHPVLCDTVLVTHNGTVTNHHSFRGKYRKEIKEFGIKEPDVDSFAISLLIHQLYPNWDNVEHVADLVRDGIGQIEGPYAFAALNSLHPDWMLLSRGRGSPLVLAHNQELGYMYASESDAIMAALGAVGFDGWTVKDIDEGRIFVLYKGQMVHAQSYEHPVRSYHVGFGGGNNSRKAKLQRRCEVEPDLIVADDSGYTEFTKHWTDYDIPWSAFEIDEKQEKYFAWLSPDQWVKKLSSSIVSTLGNASAVGYWLSSGSARTSEDTARVFVLYTGPGGFVVEQVWTGNGYKPIETWVHRGEIADVRSLWEQIPTVEEPEVVEEKDPYKVETFKFYDYWQGAHNIPIHEPVNRRLEREAADKKRKEEEKKKAPFHGGKNTQSSIGIGSGVQNITHKTYGNFFISKSIGVVPMPSGSCDGDVLHGSLPYLSHGDQWLQCESTRYAVFDLLSLMEEADLIRFAGADYMKFDPYGGELIDNTTIHIGCRLGHDWLPVDFVDGLEVEWECNICDSTRVLVTFEDERLSKYLWAKANVSRQEIIDAF